MPHEISCARPRPSPLLAKAAYSREARKKLVDSRAKLDRVMSGVKQAIATGGVTPSRQLDRNVKALETRFAAAETQLRLLQKSGEHEWDERRMALEDAWEGLAHSIKTLVARLSDGAD